MVVAPDAAEPWDAERRNAARARFLRREARLGAAKHARAAATAGSRVPATTRPQRQALIRAAVERSRAKRAAGSTVALRDGESE
jgi:hypothetical protein